MAPKMPCAPVRSLTARAIAQILLAFVVGLGAVVPVGLIFVPVGSLIPLYVLAPILALFGLWMYDHLWIKAGQALPLS